VPFPRIKVLLMQKNLCTFSSWRKYEKTLITIIVYRSSSSPRRFPGRQTSSESFGNGDGQKRSTNLSEIHFPFDEDEVMAIEYRICSINNLLKSKGFPGVNFINILLTNFLYERTFWQLFLVTYTK